MFARAATVSTLTLLTSACAIPHAIRTPPPTTDPLTAPQLDSARIPVGDSPVRGDPAALVTVVEFGDFACPYCARMQGALHRIRTVYGRDVRFVWKNTPLRSHPHALEGAEAAVEAFRQHGDEGFWRFHDALFDTGPRFVRDDLVQLAHEQSLDATRFDHAVGTDAHVDAVRADQDLATQLGVHALPTLFVNGTRVEGARPYAELSRAVDAALTRARQIDPPERAYVISVNEALAIEAQSADRGEI